MNFQSNKYYAQQFLMFDIIIDKIMLICFFNQFANKYFIIKQLTILQVMNTLVQYKPIHMEQEFSQTVINRKKKSTVDRFIPNRGTTYNDLNSYYLSTKDSLVSKEEDGYDKLITQSLFKRVKMEEQPRILSYKKKQQSIFTNSLYDLISKKNKIIQKQTNRVFSLAPEKILDAPQLKDDYYLNLMDWSPHGPLAIGLNNKVYLYTPKQIQQLCVLDQGYICSISFHSQSPLVAIGNSLGKIELYDIQKNCLIRSMRGHFNRVSSCSFNSILFTGSKDSSIIGHDIKSPNNIVMKLDGHKGQVCGLKQDPCGLASGSNDNMAMIWDINMGKPRYVLQGHKAAVKALAWCPWQRNLLATGGGTTDKTMKFWNIQTGKLINSINTQSQVCSLIWNRNEKQILSSHGYQQNQLCVWKYPQNTKLVQLYGHTQRVLHMALSPDGSTVCSGSADETLRFWKIFNGELGTNFFKKQLNYLSEGFCSIR